MWKANSAKKWKFTLLSLESISLKQLTYWFRCKSTFYVAKIPWNLFFTEQCGKVVKNRITVFTEKSSFFFLSNEQFYERINEVTLLKSWFHGNFWVWSRFIVLFHNVQKNHHFSVKSTSFQEELISRISLSMIVFYGLLFYTFIIMLRLIWRNIFDYE